MPDRTAALLAARYTLRSEGSPERLTGGYANDVVRFGEVVVRTSPPGTSEVELAYEHGLIQRLADRVPEVNAPLVGDDGSTFISLDGRLVSVFPFVPGRRGDRRSDRQRESAAEVLARMHAAGLELGPVEPRPGQPSLRDLDWRSNWMWDLDLALSVSPWPRLQGEWEELGAFVGSLEGLLFGPIHSDYYPGNVIVRRGRVCGVIDWDYARPDWLAWELARSTWEFAKDKRTHALRPERAAAFLSAYRAAGGPVPATEEALLIPFMRCVRLEEILHHLTERARNGRWDAWYTRHNWRALELLRNTQL